MDIDGDGKTLFIVITRILLLTMSMNNNITIQLTLMAR